METLKSSFRVFPVILLVLWCHASQGEGEDQSQGQGQGANHQVHNLVLYPHKHSWCEVRRVEQVVQHKSCTSKIISNSICIGQCFSYSVPRTIPGEPGDDGLDYCDTCRPTNYTWNKVVLDCDGTEGLNKHEFLVESILSCSCSSCTMPRNFHDATTTSTTTTTTTTTTAAAVEVEATAVEVEATAEPAYDEKVFWDKLLKHEVIHHVKKKEGEGRSRGHHGHRHHHGRGDDGI